MSWNQVEIKLKARPRGIHIITAEVESKIVVLPEIKVGLLHLFLQHTSASLCINENADPSVRVDMESFLNHNIREREDYYTHVLEGDDDMPAHIKSALFGVELSIPINNGKLMLGTWQGIYLCEHRNVGGSRRLIATTQGSK